MTYEKLEQARDLARELHKYAELEGSEIGETCFALCEMVERHDYVGEKFYDALIEELKECLEIFHTKTRIIEEPHTTTHTIKTLEWIDDQLGDGWE